MTHEHLDKLELIAQFLNERHRGHLLGKPPLVASTARVAYAAGCRDLIREILAAFDLTLRVLPASEPLTFEPAPAAPEETP